MASSIASILTEQGRVSADRRRRSGDRVAALVTAFGQIPAQILADRDLSKAAAAQAARQADEDRRRAEQDARLAAEEGRRAQEFATQAATAGQAAERAQRLEAVLAEPGVLKPDGTVNRVLGLNVARMMGGSGALRDFDAWERENRTAAPALMQRDPERDLVDQTTGKVITPGTPKPPEAKPLTFNAPQPVMVGGRRVLARAGSDGALYDMQGAKIQNASPDVPPSTAQPSRDPLDTRTEWAIPPGATEPQLMTEAEIRRTGAKRPAGADKPSSGQQKRVLAFFNRAQQADVDLEKMEADIQKMGLGGQARMALAPNFAQTQLGQAYTQAQRAFTEARLRKDSGAAIPDAEFDSDRKTYFAQPGDSPETLEQKRRARGAMLASLAFESGQALAEFVGDTEEAKRIVDGYKTRSTGGGGVTVPDTVKSVLKGQPAGLYTGPDGKRWRVAASGSITAAP